MQTSLFNGPQPAVTAGAGDASLESFLIRDSIYDCAPNVNNNHISFRFTSVKQGGKSGRVAGYADQVLLNDCVFRVLTGGHSKVVKSGVKGVHAYIRGRVQSTARSIRDIDVTDWELVRYDPFKGDYFWLHATGEKVSTCEAALLIDRTLYCYNPKLSNTRT